MKKLLFIAMFLYGTLQAQTNLICDKISFYSKGEKDSSYVYTGALDKLTMLYIAEPFTYLELITTKAVTRYEVVNTFKSGDTKFYTLISKESGGMYDFTYTDIQAVFFFQKDGGDNMMSFRIKQ